MMPRYGTVSERRNRLHEVIRLSGSEITLGDHTETLRVKSRLHSWNTPASVLHG